MPWSVVPTPADGSSGGQRAWRVPEEHDLVARIRGGDEVAFRTLFLGAYAALCGFIDSYVRDPDVAEELVQEILCAVWERRAVWAPRGDGGVRAYLFASARNRALRYLRHQRLVVRSGAAHAEAGEPLAMAAPAVEGEARVAALELDRAFHAAVDMLPERQRLVATLRWHHQLSHAEIARTLHISVKGVETQLGRAMRTLRARLRVFRHTR